MAPPDMHAPADAPVGLSVSEDAQARVGRHTHAPGNTPQGFVASAFQILLKDLRLEWKSREILFTMAFLATLIVLVFSFAFIAAEETTVTSNVTAGILWVAVLFSGTVGLSRTFDREREGEAIRSLLLSPVPRSAIYVGKVAATVLLMFLVELVVTPLAALFFAAGIGAHALWLAAFLFLGTIGFAAVGVIFSAALLRARSRDVLLSTLLFPIVAPVVMAGARGTSLLLDPTVPDMGGAILWTQVLVVADIVFLAVGLWTFEPVATGE